MRKRASKAEREYFARVARQNAQLSAGSPPKSMAETFARMNELPTIDPTLDHGDGDLASHLAYIAKIRAGRGRKTSS